MNTQIEEKINQIEAEMKSLGMWQKEPLPESSYDIKEAFGADKMTLPQWLQFVFIPSVRSKLESDGPWPELSQVGIYATQQFLFVKPTENPGEYTTQGSLEQKESKLVTLLREFDALFNK